MLRIAVLVATATPARAEPASRPLVLAAVTIVDGTGHAPLVNQTVVIRDGRIAHIGESSRTPLPNDAEVIDARGRFLIPGLWNMHVHSVSYEAARTAMPAVLAGGITGVRDMGAPLEDVLRLRREVRDGTLSGPHMLVAGPLLEGPLPPQLRRLSLLRSVADVAEAIEAVRSLQESGVDFVKVDDSMPRESYLAVAETARQLAIPFAGHIPPSVTAREASEAGQRTVEHLGGPHYGVLLACSTREAELHARVRVIMQGEVEAAFSGQEPDNSGLFRAELTKAIVESHDETRASALYRRFAENGTWQVPTLVALRGLWDRKDLSAEDRQNGRRLMDLELRMVLAMKRAGVKLLTGTDGPFDGAPARLYEELERLVQAGATPAEVLQAATRNPAELLGRLADSGTIERGKVADLVLLNANPLDDIRNVRRISGVVLGGRFLPRGEAK